MKRIVVAYLLILLSWNDANAQPTINEWYSFGTTQSVLGNVYATDSCYYAIGLGASSIPGIFDAAFIKFDLNGNVVTQKFLHNDTVSVRTFGYTSLVPTYDNNFVTLAEYGNYFLFIKYDPNGDTISTRLVSELFINDGLESYQPSKIVELQEDSSYTCLAQVQDTSSMEVYLTLFNITKEGNLSFYEIYPTNPGFFSILPTGLIKESDGYMISSYIPKVGGTIADHRHHVKLIKTDLSGNEIWEWTDTANLLDAEPKGFTKTLDGGYLYGGVTGWYNSTINALLYKAHIIKLNDNLSVDWEILLGDSSDFSNINFTNIVDIGNDQFAATGYIYPNSGEMKLGWLIKFDISGKLIWDSFFSYVSPTSPNVPKHEFYDIKHTTDKGFVMVGLAWDNQATFEGNPGSFGWLVKTDSNGCLVPGCQDFFNVEKYPEQVQLHLYPNPATDQLNVYYGDHNFTGNSEVQVYDLNGRLVHLWDLNSNDITYIYDVSYLDAGVYVLKVVENGVVVSIEKFVKE